MPGMTSGGVRGPRQAVAGQLATVGKRDRRVAKPSADDEVEDAAVDAAEGTPNKQN